jgi:hypothetical protein
MYIIKWPSAFGTDQIKNSGQKMEHTVIAVTYQKIDVYVQINELRNMYISVCFYIHILKHGQKKAIANTINQGK